MGTIRDQLQNLTGADLQATQLGTAGGRVFVSGNAMKTQADLHDVVRFWQNVHVPAYGQPIPGTGKTATGSGDGPMLSMATNETAYINGLSFTNADATNAADVSVEIDGALIAVVNVPPSSSAIAVGLGGAQPFSLTNPQSLTLSIAGVASSDITHALAYALTVQG